MSTNAQEPVQAPTPENDKEYNFAQLRKQAEQERYYRQQAELKAAELEKQLQSRSSPEEEDDDDSEPYVDKRKLKKELSRFEQNTKQITQTEVQRQVQQALAEERKQNWMKSNPDFYEVMQHAEKFAQKDPELAETILEMPDTFERQKLVYKNIKALGLHKKEEPRPSIQETIEKNKKSPYYQPSGIGTAPYASAGDFSASGQKNAYEKMQDLKKRLRLG